MPQKTKPRKNRTRQPLRIRDIALTDDHTFDSKFHKPNRRVVVTAEKQGKIKVNKIKSLKDKESQVAKGTLIPLKDKYKCLPRPSGVSVYQESKDGNGKRLSAKDPRIKPTGEKFSKRDFESLAKKAKH